MDSLVYSLAPVKMCSYFEIFIGNHVCRYLTYNFANNKNLALSNLKSSPSFKCLLVYFTCRSSTQLGKKETDITFLVACVQYLDLKAFENTTKVRKEAIKLRTFSKIWLNSVLQASGVHSSCNCIVVNGTLLYARFRAPQKMVETPP